MVYDKSRRVTVRYYSTKNRVSPFVAIIGEWPDRAALTKSIKNGTRLGWRYALPEEIALLDRSTRHVALYWRSLRDMLWTHRSPDLERFYPRLVARIRRVWRQVKANAMEVQKKKDAKAVLRAEEKAIAAENLGRSKPPVVSPQLSLF
jgi:hypothetical protein